MPRSQSDPYSQSNPSPPNPVDDRNPGVDTSQPPGANFDDTGSGPARSSRPKPLGGLPENYTVEVPDYYPESGFNIRGAGLKPRGTREQAPRYFDGAQFLPARYSPATIIHLQERMHSVGVLGPFRRGIWDKDSAAAYAELLGYANYRGLDAESALREMEQSANNTGTLYRGGQISFDPDTGEWVSGDSAAGQRAPLTIRHSDPMELEQVFDKAVIDTLGVGWDKTRIQNMVRAYQDLETQRQTDEYNRSPNGGEFTDLPSPTAFAQNFAEQQDPGGAEKARFLEAAGNTIPLLAQGAWGVG